MSCDIVLASAGSRGTALPGTQELARINEDAKVTPRLLALMARHTQRKCSRLKMPYGIIATDTPGTFWAESLARARGKIRALHIYSHMRLCTRAQDC